ncbi:MAG: hypothetical protein K6357_08730 [Elusimicrobiota bacterium]
MKDLIKSIIDSEIIDVNLYMKEAELFKNKIVNGEHIHDIFINFAKEETLHISALKIILKEEYKHNNFEVKVSNSLRKTLRVHLMREGESIRVYENLITKIGNDKYKETISEIIFQENWHYKTMKKYLLSIGLK